MASPRVSGCPVQPVTGLATPEEGLPGRARTNAEAALGYGRSVCDRVATKMPYADLVNQVKADFRTTDYYQAGYLINQAVNELCPAQIWQLRQSAAGYTPF